MPLSAAMMNGSLVSETSPSSTVTGMSVPAAFSRALAAPGQLNAQAASTRRQNCFVGPTAIAFVMASLSVGCAAAFGHWGQLPLRLVARSLTTPPSLPRSARGEKETTVRPGRSEDGARVTTSLLRLPEVFQVRRLLVLAG